MKHPTMEVGVKSDQGYESYDSQSACGSERPSSLSDAEFDPTSDEEEDDDDEYSKPSAGLSSDIDELADQLDATQLEARAPMKASEHARDMRRENAHPWSVQTQNSVSPSGGRVFKNDDRSFLQNYERMYNGQQQLQDVLTGNLQAHNLTPNNNNNIYTSTATAKNNSLPASSNINIYVQPPSEELATEDLSEFPELVEFAKFTEEDNTTTESDYTECIRLLFSDGNVLPELSIADVNEGFGQLLDKNDFEKISPVSFSSTIVPPSVDSYPPSPSDSYLLAALADQETLGAAVLNVQNVTNNYSNPAAVSTYSVSNSEYTSNNNSFLDIRGHRGSFSTSSTPSYPGSVEYSPPSSAGSEPSPQSASDLELYQQFSPNIIPATVNDDLGDDDGSSRSRASSRLDNTSVAKERLLQKIRADAVLNKAKFDAYLDASKTEQDKLIIAIQDLCRTVDPCVEAKFYAIMEVFIYNATQDQVVQLFESVRFQRCANVVNNPLLSAYVCEIMMNRGLE